MRENWRMVGEALLVGRRMHKADRAFGKWCKDEGFDMDARVRSDAMWLVENWGGFQQLETAESHPTGIRQAYNDSRKTGPMPLELHEVTSKPTIELDTRSAEKVVKLVKRSEGLIRLHIWITQPSSLGGSLRDHHMEQLEIPLELTDPNIYDSALGRRLLSGAPDGPFLSPLPPN